MATYTVKKGDCLWNIAKSTLGDPYRWTEIADLNNISRTNPIIYPKQVLTLPGGSSTTTTSTNVSTKVTISYFGLQAGTDTSVFVAWKWDRSDTENYQVKWYYDTGNGLWFVGSDSTVDEKQSVYGAPSNAKKTKVIIKPISKKKTVNDKETSYWTAEWSTAKEYDFSNNPPSKPGTPNVEIDGYKLTASLSNLDVNGTHIQFQIVKDDSTVFKSSSVKIITASASYSCTVDAGSDYKVRCRAVRDKVYGEWSEYSSNAGTPPAASSGITKIQANSETSVYLEWSSVKNAKTYDIEFATKREYFDGSDQTTSITGIEFNHYLKGGLESGQEYLFRIRAVNNDGTSAWSEIKSVVIGKKPAAPTTWSSSNSGITGETLTLHWMHNAEDNSPQTYAEVKVYVNGVDQLLPIIDTRSEPDDEKTMYLDINTSAYVEGMKLEWKVRTAGVTETFGDWSIQRTVDIYAPPTLYVLLTDSSNNAVETLTSFPLYIRGTAGPNTQTPIGYSVSIVANESYETVDNVGNTKTVIAGEAVYSKHYDTSEQLLLQISANSVNLENNISYTVETIVAMDSGLTASDSSDFSVSWVDEEYSPNAEIGINEDDLSAYIRPYCIDTNENLVSGLTLAVYRREFDGSFTEISRGLGNLRSTYVTDPHPSLDYARYRIVTTKDSTGAVSYYDVPGYPVNEKAIVIQWNEEWSNFEVDTDDELERPPWAGSLIKLPYNVDVSEKSELDTSLIKYIGRQHPVSYYGTQLGTSATWNTDIPKSDKETIYALRRLSVWPGDVYVREPSGVGYWAHIKVSFSQKHTELVVPVTFDITRVEGGV